MIHLDEMRQDYMLADLNTKEAHSKQTKQKIWWCTKLQIADLVMIRNFDKISNWDAK